MAPAVAAAATLVLTTGAVPAAVADPAEGGSSGTSTTVDDPVTHDENERVPEGAAWTEAYFPSAGGVELHADILRPAHLAPDARTPVILSVGPYFAHAGQTGPEGWDVVGPSVRFQDFVDGAELMANEYTFVMVDLRGYGGSTGCIDWVGPGEQADVGAAIEWSASQPWSTGDVGMYGKSYDAVTGLVGNNLGLDPLKAVVAQEPVWNMYNYLWSNEVARPNVTGTPQAYNHIATIGPMAGDSERYAANARYEDQHPECLADNLSDPNHPDPESEYWDARNLADDAAGTDTPLFVTQGFIEPNTKPEDMQVYLDNHTGVERGWLGPWDHVRGNDTVSDGRLAMGREGFFDEVMRFYDEHLKGVEPSAEDPAYAIQDSTGAWRAQDTWPEVDRSTVARLRHGAYVDDGGPSSRAATGRTAARVDGWDMENAPALPERGRSAARAGAASSSYLTFSRPVASAVRITGTPSVSLRAGGSGDVMVRLWDVAPDGTATMFDENVARIERRGRTAFDLKSADWTLAEGHQLGVQIGTIESDGWLAEPSGKRVLVTGARLSLDLQDPSGDTATEGAPAPYLERYLSWYTTTFADVGKGSFVLNP
ncbi:CocE/NonD family hydrolase [Promicromonospora iranensis]|uniref:CocE/NonD family hydrolase n=1 Tax=Promicromonospora iranensis TaxID=1105144 RepID=A0ABU2CQX5_9MICO|nr:CocE/NonD family hydrolase [Promicromonospora iranensis]MDR7383552.1 putative CocE/NonD family hydrolase [Promicromonospora iranensis]